MQHYEGKQFPEDHLHWWITDSDNPALKQRMETLLIMRGNEAGVRVTSLCRYKCLRNQERRSKKWENERTNILEEIFLYSAHASQNISSVLFRHNSKLQYDALGQRKPSYNKLPRIILKAGVQTRSFFCTAGQRGMIDQQTNHSKVPSQWSSELVRI